MPSTTVIGISEGCSCINQQPTCSGRFWKRWEVEGLLMNSRVVQGICDDLNTETSSMWDYTDGPWEPERNIDEFVEAMPDWR